MTTFRLSPEVAEAFPDTVIALVTATGLRGGEPWPESAAALEELEKECSVGTWQPADEHDPRVAAWHTAYRAFGTDPRRVRPSVDALGRRLVRKGDLPRINSAVDTYNALSVRHGVPVGGFDLDAVAGEVVIRFADGTEEFTRLGEPDNTEHPKSGEVVYVDSESVLTRHWNHRDAHRTRVTEDSRRVVFLLETPEGEQHGGLVTRAAGQLQELLAPHADGVTVRHIRSGKPQITV